MTTREKLLKDYVLVTQDKALEHLSHENPLDSLLTLVEIMKEMIQTSEGIDDKFKQRMEFLFKSYLFYHTLLKEE